MNKKDLITGIVIGICIAVVSLSVWYLFNLNRRVTTIETVNSQIVNFLNNNAQQVQGATPIQIEASKESTENK